MSITFVRRSLTLAVASAIYLQTILAQQPGTNTGPTAPGGTPGSVGTAPGGTPPGGNVPGIPSRIPNTRPTMDPNQQQFPEMQRPIFLSGKVVMEDGTPPPDPVTIERVCNGTPRPEGYTDSKGRFSFQLGQNNSMFQDASVASTPDPAFGGPSGSPQRSGGFGQQRGITERELMGCELRASLPGFRSEPVSLAGRRVMDNPEVGTIILHRLAKVDGFTFSGTTAFAPKDAQKAFNKGKDLLKKKKLSEAETEFQKAVNLYPKYAVGWYELGLVYQQQKKIDEARQAYDASLKADSKFVTPYAQLARIELSQSNWQGVADYTGKVIKLNPYFSPEMYFYSAVANLNLKNLDQAEEHAKEALKMDSQHRNPKANHVLGVILAQKQDYPGAAENLNLYLKFAPNASDADIVKKQLAELQGLATGGKNAQPGEKTP
ncbi:MAG TPA: porin [Bryobacteraceae bacterium]|nr:porin [Bryobacteraceae bacterium]